MKRKIRKARTGRESGNRTGKELKSGNREIGKSETGGRCGGQRGERMKYEG
jgi:hypothetical protein